MGDSLVELEQTMGCLRDLRNQRIAAAEEAIRRANIEFDRDALPLGRKINALRAAAAKPVDKPKVRVTRKPSQPDPNWSQEDIDHWHELQRREARNGQ